MRLSSILAIMCLFFSMQLLAMPTSPKVIQGGARLAQKDNNLSVTTKKHSIIEWDDFSIDTDEMVNIIQPGKRSCVLNRVVGGLESYILGRLNSNGQIYIINPHGVFIGNDAIVEAQSFLASSLDLSNDDFIEKRDMHFKGENKNHVVNLGKIYVNGGDVYLISYHIDNQGEIIAPEGFVGLAVGEDVLIKPYDEERVFVKVSPTRKISTEDEGIGNTGIIKSVSTEIKIDGNLHDFAIRNEGVIDARGVREDNGHIYLVAEEGEMDILGSFTAKTSDNNGGEVRILGKTVHVDETAKIDVSGENVGGKVLIGGDFKGKNPKIYNSTRTYVDATINADAIKNGNGGMVVIWSDGKTHFDGVITARGGEEKGNGGFCEISGKEYLRTAGKIDLKAYSGESGTLLLDPKFIVIDPNGTDSAASASNTFATNPTTTHYIAGSDIAALLDAGTAVTLQANSDINIIDDVTTTAATATFTLDAGRSIFLGQDCSIMIGGPLVVKYNDENCTGANRNSGLGRFAMYEGSAILTTGTSSTITIDAGTEEAVKGDITLLGSYMKTKGSSATISLGTTNASEIWLGSNIITQAATITLSKAVTLIGDSEVSSATAASGATITFSSTIDGAYKLDVNSGTGSITLSDKVGSIEPLKQFNVIGAAGVPDVVSVGN